MSFSVEFHAVNEKAALAALEKAYLPDQVRRFIQTALTALKPPYSAVHVKAHGHLYDGCGGYATSNAHIEVTPVYLQPEPIAEGRLVDVASTGPSPDYSLQNVKQAS